MRRGHRRTSAAPIAATANRMPAIVSQIAGYTLTRAAARPGARDRPRPSISTKAFSSFTSRRYTPVLSPQHPVAEPPGDLDLDVDARPARAALTRVRLKRT